MSTVISPKIYLEKTANNEVFVRVEEQRQEGFVATPKLDFSNRTINDSGAYAGVKAHSHGADVQITDYTINNTRVGVSLQGTDDANIYNMKFDGFSVKTPEVYGSVIRIGTEKASDGTSGITTVQRIYADGNVVDSIGTNGASYKTTNKDFAAIERGGNIVYVRDVTAHNFSDAMFDVKGGNTVYIMNATFSETSRTIRAWDGAHIVLVNCVIDVPEGKKAVWLGGSNAEVEYYNTTFNGASTLPESLISRDKSGIPTPTKLDYNPLENIDFFKSHVNQVHVELSTDGKNWVALDTGNGAASSAPIGDNLFNITNMSSDYFVRSYYTLSDGSRSGYSDLAHHATNGEVSYLEAPPQFEFTGTAAGDTVDAGDYGSTISTGGGMDKIHAGDGADYIDGGAKNDSVYYSDASKGVTVDLLDSSANAGSADGDTLISIERLFGSQHDDRLLGSNGENWLQGENGNDYIDGRDGHDRLEGSSGNDTLIGGAGNDRLQGGNDRDILSGGAGSDTLSGGSGADTFFFTKADLGNVDTIKDFSKFSGDTIDLRQLFDQPLSDVDSLSGYLHIVAQGEDALLQVDTNGNGSFTDLTTITNGAKTLANASIIQLVNDGVLNVL